MQEVRRVQQEVEQQIIADAREHDELALNYYKMEHSGDTGGLPGSLQLTPSDMSATELIATLYTKFSLSTGDMVVSRWQELQESLFTRYHDGAMATNLDGERIAMVKMFYPRWWLNATGYFDKKPIWGPGVLMFQGSPVAVEQATPAAAHSAQLKYSAAYLLLCTVGALVLGVCIGRTWGSKAPSSMGVSMDGSGSGGGSGAGYGGMGVTSLGAGSVEGSTGKALHVYDYEPIGQSETSALV